VLITFGFRSNEVKQARRKQFKKRRRGVNLFHLKNFLTSKNKTKAKANNNTNNKKNDKTKGRGQIPISGEGVAA
jgi:hypothetical protein